jgi:regulator of RNase E activity RraA
MPQAKRSELAAVRHKLAGIIPPERIARVKFPRPSPLVIEAFKKIPDPTPTISDVLDGLGINGIVSASVLRPLLPDRVVVGPALTLRYEPERLTVTKGYIENEKSKLAHLDALAIAEPGDVLVIDAGGQETSVTGGLAALSALKAGLAGSIVDGGVRDVGGIRQLGYPVWSRHITPRSGKLRLEAVEINGPVMVAGVQVNPGDLIVADATGVAVIPCGLAERVLREVQATVEKEEKIAELMEKGAGLEAMGQVLPPTRW